jgi:hypothetical protein
MPPSSIRNSYQTHPSAMLLALAQLALFGTAVLAVPQASV